MKRTLMAQTGLSLVEATIILMVLAILTAVLAPTINDYVEDARGARAKEDVEAIGISIARLLRDTGFPFLVEDATVTAANRFKIANRADLAVGTGNIPIVQTGVVDGKTADANAQHRAVAWTDALSEPSGKVSLHNQLVRNEPQYTSPNDTVDTATPTAPGSLGAFGLGWRGAYLNGIIGPDPWGFRYACSTIFLGAATDATGTNGGATVGWADDARCLSAGRNNQIEVNFIHTFNGTAFAGTQNDDVVYVISGFGK